MTRSVEFFDHNYDFDTAIEYVNTGKYSMLNCSFTSEDEDYGTDTIHSSPAKPPKPREQMAYEMALEIAAYLDATDDGVYRKNGAPYEKQYGDFSNSTLYAIEKALKDLAGDYKPVIRNSRGNEIQIVTIKEAGKIIKDAVAKDRNVRFDFGVGVNDGAGIGNFIGGDDLWWFGVKLLPNDTKLFDGGGSFDTDYIFMCGCWGGGNITMAYFCTEDCISIEEWDADELVDAMCNSCGASRDTKILLEKIEKECNDNE